MGVAEKLWYDYDWPVWSIIMPSDENETGGLPHLIGIVVAVTAAIALQAWLVQMSIGFIWPFFSLPFWQWMVIVLTVRSLLSPLINE